MSLVINMMKEKTKKKISKALKGRNFGYKFQRRKNGLIKQEKELKEKALEEGAEVPKKRGKPKKAEKPKF